VAVVSEILAVTDLDAATRTILTVTRGAEDSTAATHAVGAQVYAPVAKLASAAAIGDTSLTLAAPLSGILPAGSIPAGFIATMPGSDFSGPFIIGYGSSPSRCGPVTAMPLRPNPRPPSFRRDPFARDVALDPGRASAPRIPVPHMLPSSE
jgi:hypothetical protein